jgi:hypothetical protein
MTAPSTGENRWRRFGASLPMRTALVAVGTVWILGCVWSYQEQSAFATSKGFTFPHLLPLVIDGFAVSMAGVAWAASLDARPAIPARLATLVAVAASSTSNGVWAYLRAHHDITTVILGIAVPVAANLAFEVLLAELRRQVQRRRGLPPPVAVPYPRLIRIALAPWQTFRDWRSLILEITAIDHIVVRTLSATTSESGLRTPAASDEAAADDYPPIADPTLADQAVLPAATRPAVPTAGSGLIPLTSVPPDAGPAEYTDARLSRDLRVERLLEYLSAIDDPDEVTGDMVGPLLDTEIAPRTGRRLLGQARELLSKRIQPNDLQDRELSAVNTH